MLARSSAWVAVACVSWFAVAACASGPGRLERYTALSPEAKADYDKYSQFMTDRQQEVYLGAGADEERRRMVAELRIDERLARYPAPMQRAIWSREVLAGMDKAAVFLSWGSPFAVDRLWVDDPSKAGQEIWYYRRGMNGDEWRVVLASDTVTEVVAPLR